MGVAPGRTTVIATTRRGAAIAQYDVTVTPGAGAAALPAAAAAPAAGPITPAMALAIQAAIARTVRAHQSVRVQAAGSDAILTGHGPERGGGAAGRGNRRAAMSAIRAA